ncbi:hypothetical protein RND71_009974 [Anisodus tanguticus]|uniref:Uncharacterized protein n=1 Tax=Anisodus tanguticus TaxID=243964 RepID=A0AAE1SGV3_9SOLA|nr:hypothetical protein RND71_009974 [Anisodus tanguticus]
MIGYSGCACDVLESSLTMEFDFGALLEKMKMLLASDHALTYSLSLSAHVS